MISKVWLFMKKIWPQLFKGWIALSTRMWCMVSLSLRSLLCHEIWPYPGNTATPLIRPNCFDPLVTILMRFHCNLLFLHIIVHGKAYPRSWISSSVFKHTARRADPWVTCQILPSCQFVKHLLKHILKSGISDQVFQLLGISFQVV